MLGFIILFADASRSLVQPISSITGHALSLDPAICPAMRCAPTSHAGRDGGVAGLYLHLRHWAAKSRGRSILVPVLDILQSVPILGFLSVTVVWFLSLSPGRIFGAELAAIFAIFTSQAWNMAFSFYQSLRTVPHELDEAAACSASTPGRASGGWRLPFAMPALIWNMMMSMSGGWFFVIASEAISVGNTNIALPGVGSYIAVAIAQKNLAAIF